MQQACQLRADGLTVRGIAKKLGVRKVETVSRWIKKGKRDEETKTRKQ
jgi:transposase